MRVQPGFSSGRGVYHIIIFADTGKRWICSVADCNVQETCSLTIFLSPPTDREGDEEEQHCHFPELHFRPWGLITNHVNVFMFNKLIRFRMFCHRVCADACSPGSIRLVLNPRVVVRTRLNCTHGNIPYKLFRYMPWWVTLE